jgi:osmotically-inducible protein OsmY
MTGSSAPQYGGGVMGRFAGRGPKGYTRSDERILEDIHQRLTDHPEVDASEIDVQISGGEVTLSGTVDHRHAKRLAEDIAEEVRGVREVHNQLRVKHRQNVDIGGR